MTTHIIYHDHCMDGFGAAYIVAKYLEGEGAKYKLTPASYGKQWPEYFLFDDQPEDTVYIVDFSFPPEELIEICSCHAQVIWLDHHKTAIEAFEKWCKADEHVIPANLEFVLDQTRSGAGITWDFTWGTATRPLWVDLIEDRDLWKFQFNDTKPFNAGLGMVAKTLESWDMAFENGYVWIIEAGRTALQIQAKHVESICENAQEIYICGHKGLAANCPGVFASDVGHELQKRSGTFGASWYQDKVGNIKWSLRSEGDYDVSAIAKQFGGGGHKNAAGFTLTDPTGGEGIITVYNAVVSGGRHEL